jgi:drug/metabolite transporter (DMT)-like permease
MNYQGTKSNKGHRSLILLIAAFAAVYIVWGSTYLSIKYAIETIPPFLMAGLRFASAGAILYLIARLSPDFERPKLVHWRTSAVVGILLLVIGNGGVVYAERFIPSSLTALLVATEPFWIVLLSWLWLKGSRPTRKAALGLILGFVGVAVLITGQGAAPAAESLGPGQLWTTLAVMAAALSWAAGSIYGLRSPVPSSALLAAGMQMLAGGVALLVVSVFAGEWSTFSFNQVSSNSWYGLGYLIVFGSLIGFTAYSWLLKNAEPTMVATYAYVNPVIAVILGWLIAGESMTMQMLIGAAVVVGSVVLITSKNEVVKEQDGASELGDACSHSAAPRFST